MIDPGKLRAFAVVAQELNFRRSAERLSMSQPPLSRLIAQMEEEIGTLLFERTTRSVRLTEAGELLFAEAKAILARLEKVTHQIRGLREQTLVVGFSSVAFTAGLPELLDRFAQTHSKVRVHLREEPKAALYAGLRMQTLDLCFVEGELDEPGWGARIVAHQPMGVLMATGHRLAGRKRLTLYDLAQERLIFHSRREAPAFYRSLETALRQRSLTPSIYIKRPHESCPILVALGKGVLLTVASTGQQLPARTRFVPLAGLRLPITAFWKQGSTHPGLARFLAFLAREPVPTGTPVAQARRRATPSRARSAHRGR